VLALLAAWRWIPLAPEPLWLPTAGEGRPVDEPIFSLLAVGDTGDQHWLPSWREGQLSVARAMTALDFASRVDVLLLLGDNFYPDGLMAHEMLSRIRDNLVWPYCRFVELDGPRSDEVRDACSLSPDLRRADPPAIYATFGNHDRDSPESVGLQRTAIPLRVSNWYAPPGLVEVIEEGSLSLVLVDSPLLSGEEEILQVVDALRASRGDWRVVAAHHPVTRPVQGAMDGPSAALRRALSESGVQVQLLLAGHRHNLQAVAGWEGGPALQVIAGSGSTHRPLREIEEERLFGRDANGFVRVDLEESSGREVMRVSLYVTPRYPVVFWRNAALSASFLLTLDGRVIREWNSTDLLDGHPETRLTE